MQKNEKDSKYRNLGNSTGLTPRHLSLEEVDDIISLFPLPLSVDMPTAATRKDDPDTIVIRALAFSNLPLVKGKVTQLTDLTTGCVRVLLEKLKKNPDMVITPAQLIRWRDVVTVSGTAHKELLHGVRENLSKVVIALPPAGETKLGLTLQELMEQKIKEKDLQYLLQEEQKSKNLPAISSLLNKIQKLKLDTYNKFKREVISSYLKTRETAGRPVGLDASDALGAITMQASLNTFHSAGSSKSNGSATKTISEILFANKNRNTPLIYLFFRDKNLTYGDAYSMRTHFVESKFSSFMESEIVIADYSTLDEKPQTRDSEFAGEVIRVNLSKESLFFSRLSPYQLVKKIRAELPEETAKYNIIYGSVHDAYIDFQHKQGEKEGETEEEFALFMQTTAENVEFVAKLNEVVISGYSGITAGDVRKFLYSSCFDGKNMTFLPRPAKLHGITPKVIAARLAKAGFADVDVTVPGWINKFSEEHKKVIATKMRTEFYIVYLICAGKGLEPLLCDKKVDPTISWSNNMYEMQELFGVDVAKSSTMRDLLNALSNSGHINHTHIKLIIDFIFCRGKPLASSFTGISQQDNSFLALMMLEKIGKVMAERGGMGDTDVLQGNAAGVAAGIVLKGAGTGYKGFEIISDSKHIEEVKLASKKIEENQKVSLRNLSGDIAKTTYISTDENGADSTTGNIAFSREGTENLSEIKVGEVKKNTSTFKSIFGKSSTVFINPITEEDDKGTKLLFDMMKTNTEKKEAVAVTNIDYTDEKTTDERLCNVKYFAQGMYNEYYRKNYAILIREAFSFPDNTPIKSAPVELKNISNDIEFFGIVSKAENGEEIKKEEDETRKLLEKNADVKASSVGVILDIGGDGQVASTIFSRGGKTIRRICANIYDVPQEKRLEGVEYLNIAKTNYKIDLPDESVDTIITDKTLRHFTDLDFLLQEINRVLCVKGKIVVRESNCDNDNKRHFISLMTVMQNLKNKTYLHIPYSSSVHLCREISFWDGRLSALFTPTRRVKENPISEGKENPTDMYTLTFQKRA